MKKTTEQQYAEVSPELKELWSVELDLLSKFAAVCKEHNLKWYVDGGTLLGAVRHRGFIPWDDDIDICMPYADYCKLCKMSSLFEEPYFLQTWMSQDGWHPYLSRLRRSDTTGYTKWESKNPKDWNKGVFIDIFAMSYIPDNHFIELTQGMLLKGIRGLYYGYESKRDGTPAANNMVLSYILKGAYTLFSIIWDYKRLADLYVSIGGWQKERSKKCGLLLFKPLSSIFTWKTEWYKDTIMMDFMETSVPCPIEFDERLTCQYGDYMTPVKAASYHGSLIVDLHHSYKEYM